MKRILLVDDEKEVVRLVKTYLEQAGFIVFSAYNGESAQHLLRLEKPDLLILDLGLPDWDGWDLIRMVRNDKYLAALPVIMLTARVEDSDKLIGLELGADDYITKPFNPKEVVARVRALLRRANMSNDKQYHILENGDLRLDPQYREVSIKKTLLSLTPTEYSLLYKFLENPGLIFSREQLLDAACGYDFEGDGRTLDTHMKNLRKKIEPDPKNPIYIETVYGIGYRFKREK